MRSFSHCDNKRLPLDKKLDDIFTPFYISNANYL